MPDADPQPPEVFRAELLLDIAEPVMTRDAAAELQLHGARRKIQLVVRDEQLLGLDLVEARERADRVARKVHVGLRHHQPDVAGQPRGVGIELRFRAERDALARRQPLREPEARVVPVALVAPARVTEPCDQPDGHGTKKARRSPAAPRGSATPATSARPCRPWRASRASRARPPFRASRAAAWRPAPATPAPLPRPRPLPLPRRARPSAAPPRRPRGSRRGGGPARRPSGTSALGRGSSAQR